MKTIFFIFLITGTSLLAQTNELQNDAQLFLPELFKEFPNVRDIAISKNKREMYFTVEGFKKEFSFIAVTVFEKGKWSKPKVASFSGKDKDLEAFLSPDNLKLYFASNRKVLSETEKNDMDIWIVERISINSEWSRPKNLGFPINTEKDEFYPSVSTSGNLYFTASYQDSKGKEDIYMSNYANGKYEKPKSLPAAINSSTYEFNAFISPNEEIIVFSSYKREDSFGGTDLYLSRKDKNGLWLKAKNIGPKINSAKIDYCPFIDFASKTLYYTSEKSEQRKQFNSQLTMDDILDKMVNRPNGMSRIYQVKNFQKHID